MNKDPMGTAIADYQAHGTAKRLRVFSPEFDEDELPVALLFRTYHDMPILEQKALQMVNGRTLDVGAGAGCHTLALQDMGNTVEAIDISERAVQAMYARGVKQARVANFFNLNPTHEAERYDTLLMLMNGAGIGGRLSRMPMLFATIDRLLRQGGQALMDSTDIRYVYEDDEGGVALPEKPYYGELQYSMQYGQVRGEWFEWLYVDFDTLQQCAQQAGFVAELVATNAEHGYLARVTRG